MTDQIKCLAGSQRLKCRFPLNLSTDAPGEQASLLLHPGCPPVSGRGRGHEPGRRRGLPTAYRLAARPPPHPPPPSAVCPPPAHAPTPPLTPTPGHSPLPTAETRGRGEFAFFPSLTSLRAATPGGTAAAETAVAPAAAAGAGGASAEAGGRVRAVRNLGHVPVFHVPLRVVLQSALPGDRLVLTHDLPDPVSQPLAD